MRIAALILAAGQSRRFSGGNKLLADLNGRTVLARTVDAVLAAALDDAIVVTGEAHEEIARALPASSVRFLQCPADRGGMGDTIATGIAGLGAGYDGVLILPGDMPLITPETLNRLTAAFRAHDGQCIIYAATREGAQRNPVLWPKRTFAALSRLSGETGGKAILRSEGPAAIGVPACEDAELFDIDDEAALEMARAFLSRRAQPD